MSGGLLQIVAYGAQDVYLTGSPTITFWKVMYRRYASFAMESIEQVFSGTVSWNKRVSTTISRNGDLINGAFIEIQMMKGQGNTYYPAEALLKEVSCSIGGITMDKHYSTWYRMHDSLFRTGDQKQSYMGLTDFVDGEAPGTVKRFYVPLIFWWNTLAGLSLPLVALQYHEVRVDITFADASDVIGVDPTYIPQASLWVDYIFLDADERRRTAQTQSEYLITTLQFTGDETVQVASGKQVQSNIRLNYNHPSKYLAWAICGPTHGQFTGGPLGTTAEAYAPLRHAKLQLNGHDRAAGRHGSYFTSVQSFQFLGWKPMAGIYMYSFSLRPSPYEHQPSGSCNFSRIDNTSLSLSFKAANPAATYVTDVLDENTTVANSTYLTNLRVFTQSYNILKVMSGMAGLAFSS